MRLYGPGVCGGHDATVTTMCQVGPYNDRITIAVVVLKGACLIVGDGCAAVTLSIALVGYRHGRFDQWAPVTAGHSQTVANRGGTVRFRTFP